MGGVQKRFRDRPPSAPGRIEQRISCNGVRAGALARVLTGSAPVVLTECYGAVAQLGERRNRTAEVEGSTPFGSTKTISRCPVAEVSEQRLICHQQIASSSLSGDTTMLSHRPAFAKRCPIPWPPVFRG